MAPRRLAEEQPDQFAFSAENAAWAGQQIKKYPEGRQASAVIPLLWRAQEQEGWVSRPAIEEVARLLDMPDIRVLEVATFYTMFQLQPVGSIAHIQVCGTTPCMLRGSEDLMRICRDRIAQHPHDVSADGRFSWEEMECLGACVNAPMIQIGKDTYEDLTPKSFERILNRLEKGEPIVPGPQVKRHYSAPSSGPTTLKDLESPRPAAGELELPSAPVQSQEAESDEVPSPAGENEEAQHPDSAQTKMDYATDTDSVEEEPELFSVAPLEGADDLKSISGVGPKLEKLLNDMGIYRFSQIAAWTPGNIAWVDERLKFKGRVTRDDWVGQAVTLAKTDTSED